MSPVLERAPCACDCGGVELEGVAPTFGTTIVVLGILVTAHAINALRVYYLTPYAAHFSANRAKTAPIPGLYRQCQRCSSTIYDTYLPAGSLELGGMSRTVENLCWVEFVVSVVHSGLINLSRTVVSVTIMEVNAIHAPEA